MLGAEDGEETLLSSLKNFNYVYASPVVRSMHWFMGKNRCRTDIFSQFDCDDDLDVAQKSLEHLFSLGSEVRCKLLQLHQTFTSQLSRYDFDEF